MAGTIAADTLTHSTAGSIATNYVVEGSAKAWVRYNGTGTAAISDSFNTASITDDGTGAYTFAFSSSMNNSNFACNATSKEVDGSLANNNGTGAMLHTYATGSFKVLSYSPDGNGRDPAVGNTSTHGDLA
jgi:hypothetical protein